MRGISQERLAADSGVDRAYISELERKLANPSIPLLDRIAETLGVPLADLFEQPRADATPPQPLRSGRKARTA